MIVLVIVLVPATVLAAAWFWLLGRVTREDWVTAAYNRVLDGRLEEERLAPEGRPAGGNAGAVSRAWPPRPWAWCWAGDSQKKIEKLRAGGRGSAQRRSAEREPV